MTIRPLARYHPCTYPSCASRAQVSIYSAVLRVLVGRGCRWHRGLFVDVCRFVEKLRREENTKHGKS